MMEKLMADLKAAMRAGDSARRDCIRSLITELKNAAIAQKRDVAALPESDVIAVLKRAKKQRDEAAAQYAAAGKDDAARKERDEAALIATYLPAQMDDAALRAIVAEVVEGGATQFGAVMGQVMARVGSAADGARVKAIVEEVLAQ